LLCKFASKREDGYFGSRWLPDDDKGDGAAYAETADHPPIATQDARVRSGADDDRVAARDPRDGSQNLGRAAVRGLE